jgi:ribosome biogenesis GTPase / thiamine phosphate phosphatase
MKGLVLKSTGSFYSVKTEDSHIITCHIKGKMRTLGIKSTNPVAVGDYVEYELAGESEGVIVNILDRKNYIIRKSSNLSKQTHIIAANIDEAFLIITLAFPETSFEFIDRFLASAEAYRIPVTLVLNKMDIYLEPFKELIDEVHEIYEKIGYPIIETSTTKNINIDILKRKLLNKVSVFAGNSGVGKSSLINCLSPEFKLKTGKISDYHLKGKHTTTFAEMFEIPGGGYIVDTPGIKGFGMVLMDKEEIYHFFPDIFKFSENCQYHNCLHIDEPKCAVKEAVNNGQISESRYYSYRSILADEDSKYR